MSPIVASSDQVLVFVDRIQFEAADVQGAEEEPKERPHSWETDPIQEVQSLMSELEPPPEGDEILPQARRHRAAAAGKRACFGLLE